MLKDFKSIVFKTNANFFSNCINFFYNNKYALPTAVLKSNTKILVYACAPKTILSFGTYLGENKVILLLLRLHEGTFSGQSQRFVSGLKAKPVEQNMSTARPSMHMRYCPQSLTFSPRDGKKPY